MPLRILIVDDQWMARNAIRVALRFCRTNDLEIVGEAEDGPTALDMARQLEPDVVTMDIDLPGMSGLEATRRLKAERPQVQVVVVTLHAERRYRREAAEAGAASCIDKMRLIDELPTCLDNLYQLGAERTVPGEKHIP